MSWPTWSAAPGPIPAAMAAPVQSTLLPTAINSAPSVMPPGLQYSPEQWAQAQQQNWQQWAQWQQQYQQWHQQYGAEYQKSMSAIQGTMATAQPPLPSMPNTGVPPPLPAENKPPLPPEEPPATQPANIPSYSTAPPKPVQSGYSTAPPIATQQTQSTSQTGGSYGAQRTGDSYGAQRTGDSYGAQRTGESYGAQRTGESYGAQRTGDSYGSQRQNWQTSQGNKRPYSQGADYENPKRPLIDRPNQWGNQKPMPNQWSNQPPQNSSYHTQPPPQAHPKPNIEELSEAEKKFDKEFAAWEAQFNKWKEQNANHPDKTQYLEYEKKWESWRNSLLERREQMRRKRLAMVAASSSSKPALGYNQPPPPQQPVADMSRAPPVVPGPSQHPPQPSQHPPQPSQHSPQPSQQAPQPPQQPPQPPQQPPQYPSQQPITEPPATDPVVPDTAAITNPPPHQNNEPLNFKPPSSSFPTEEVSENVGEGFLKSSSTSGGIPGLDLVKEDDGNESKQGDVIDLDTEEKTEANLQEQPPSKGPDLDAISKGINTILGDQKLLSMLSMVSQNPPAAPPPNIATDSVSNITTDRPQGEHNFSAPPPPQHYSGGNFSAPPPPHQYGETLPQANFPSYNEQSNQGYDDKPLNDNYQQRESVNNFDDQTRSSFTMGPSDQDTGFGGNSLSRNQNNKFPPTRFGGMPPESDRLNRGPFGQGSLRTSDPVLGSDNRNKFGPTRGDFGSGGPGLFPKDSGNFGQGDNFKRGEFNRSNNFNRNEGFNRGDNYGNFGRGDNFQDEKFGPGNKFGYNDGFNRSGNSFRRDNYGTGGFDDRRGNFDDRRGNFGGGSNFNRSDNFNQRDGFNNKIGRGNDYDRDDDYENYEDNDYDKYHEMFNDDDENQGVSPQNRNQGPSSRFAKQGLQSRMMDQGPPSRIMDQGPSSRMMNQGTPLQRKMDQGGPQSRMMDQGPLLRMADQGPPSRMMDQMPSSRMTVQGPPPRITDQGPPSRMMDQGPLSRMMDQGPSSRMMDQGPPSRMMDQGTPSRMMDQGTPSRMMDQAPPSRMIDQGPPSGIMDQEPPSRMLDAPPPVVAPEPAPVEEIFEPATVIDYEHKSQKTPEPEVVVEPIHMFDYRHKPLNRIPLPQRPEWLSETVKFIREFDPLISRPVLNFERPVERYPRDLRRDDPENRYGPRGRDYYDERDRRHADEYDERDRMERRSFNRSDRDSRENDDRNRRRFNDDDRYGRRRNNNGEPKSDDRSRNRSKDDFDELSDDDLNDFESGEVKKHQQNRIERSRSRSPILSNPPNPSVTEITMIEDIINPPGRFNRPPRIVIILRGPPGSGKTYLAKLIKDKEVENGGSAPRILSLDDYFMVEHEKEMVEDGKTVKVKEMVYEYEADMEESYRTSFIKFFKKTITDGYFPFIIVDNVNDKVKYFGEMWSYAKQNGFQVYICQMDLDPVLCTKRNIHNRGEAEIEECIAGWEPTPAHHPTIDASVLLQSSTISEVEMEEVEQQPEVANKEEAAEDEVRSKWDTFDCSVNNLAKLDGVNKPLRSSRTMEEFLQLEDRWEDAKPTKPGQKRVRWADLEEQRKQKKMREIGFIVGHTNWDRMMDPMEGSSALIQTKYIDRVRRF